MELLEQRLPLAYVDYNSASLPEKAIFKGDLFTEIPVVVFQVACLGFGLAIQLAQCAQGSTGQQLV